MLPGRCVTVAGLVLVRQRPGTGNAIFMTLEDETGIANTILWPRVFESFRPIVLGARLISVTGKLQNEKGVIHIVAARVRGSDAAAAPLVGGRATSSIRPRRPTKPSGRCRAHGGIRARPCCRSTRRSPKTTTAPAIRARGDSFVQMTKEKPAVLQQAEVQHVAKVLPKGRNFH